MSNEDRRSQYMNRNVKLSPLYIALTWDVIFVWTISTMFFANQKGLTYSEIIALDSVLMFAGCLLSVPVGKWFEKVGSVVASRIGTLGYAAYLLICLIAPPKQFFIFALATVFLSFGYIVNGIKVNMILTESLSIVKRDRDYQRVFGRGLSVHYIIETIGAILITYVYSWNPYACYILSLAVVVAVEVYSFLFKEPKKFQRKNVNINSNVATNKTKKKKRKESFKKFISLFFVCLLIYMFLMRGLLSITGSAYKIYLNQLIDQNIIPLWTFGYLYAGCRLASALSSRYQFKFNLKFGVKSLVIFTTLSLLTFTINGVAFLINSTALITIVVISLSSWIQCAIISPCRILVNNYMQVCLPKKNLERFYSVRISIEYLGYALISALYAAMLSAFNDNYGKTNLIYISIFAIPVLLAMGLFIWQLCKKYAEMNTIIKDKYTKD